MLGSPNGKQPWIDALRLPARDEADLLAELDKQSQAGGSRDERRTDERLRYDVKAGLIVQVHHPGGSTITYLVLARNLSSRGVAFLHGSFLYAGTRCVMVLKKLNQQAVRIEGRVVRCEHVRGHVHEIGVQFVQALRLADFVFSAPKPGPGGDLSAALPQLVGRVLHVDDSVNEQELVRFQLSCVGLTMDAAAGGTEGLRKSERVRYDAVLTGTWLPGMSGPDLAAALRKRGFHGPIVALTADDRRETRVEAIERGCTAVLLKPHRLEDLVYLLGQFLPAAEAGAGSNPLVSDLWGNTGMRPIILGFLGRLEGQVADIRRRLEAGTAGDLAQKLCLDLKGSAGGYGYPQIGQAASRLVQMLREGASLEAMRSELVSLEQLCQAARQVLNPSAASAPAHAAPATAGEAPDAPLATPLAADQGAGPAAPSGEDAKAA